MGALHVVKPGQALLFQGFSHPQRRAASALPPENARQQGRGKTFVQAGGGEKEGIGAGLHVQGNVLDAGRFLPAALFLPPFAKTAQKLRPGLLFQSRSGAPAGHLASGKNPQRSAPAQMPHSNAQ